MNIKSGAAKLGKSQSWLVQRLRRLNVNKIKGRYYLTESDLDRVEALQRKKRCSALAEISSDLKLPKRTVMRVADKCGWKFRNDKDKIIKACEMHKTRYYTLKGIKHFIHEK